MCPCILTLTKHQAQPSPLGPASGESGKDGSRSKSWSSQCAKLQTQPLAAFELNLALTGKNSNVMLSSMLRSL